MHHNIFLQRHPQQNWDKVCPSSAVVKNIYSTYHENVYEIYILQEALIMLRNITKKVVAFGLVACIAVGTVLITPVASSYCEEATRIRVDRPIEPVED